MIGSDLGRLAVFAALPFANSAGGDRRARGRSPASATRSSGRPSSPGFRTSSPRTSSPAANALLQIVEWSTTALGPLLGGVLVAISGPNLAYIVNAVTFGVSAALVSLHPGAAAPERAPDRPRPLERPRRGLHDGAPLARALMRARRLVDRDGRERDRERRRDLPRARRPSTPATSGSGCSGRAPGIGLVIGGLVGGAVDRAGPRRRAYVRFLAVFAVGFGCAAVAPNVWVGAVAMALAGFGNGGAVVANITLVQRGAPDRVRGRAFTAGDERELRRARARVRRRRPVHERLRPALGLRRRRAAPSRLRPPLAALRFTRGIEARARARRRSAHDADGSRRRGACRSGVGAGETRALARAISLVEDGDPAARELVPPPLPATGPRARRRLHRAARRRQVDA